MPKLQVDAVQVTYPRAGGSVEALHDVSFSVRQGEFVSMLGRSGCGKSTLFNVVAGLLAPTAGAVRVDGLVVSGQPGHAGYMMQHDHLFPWRSVLDNVVLGLDVLGEDHRRSRERARELLPKFGLGDFETHYPSSLSGGMRQRAALMRTMLLNRNLILLDEPFGALDAITRAEMQEWLLSIRDEFDRTVLFITHDVEEAIFLSDRVVVMGGRPGRIQDVIDVDIERPRHYGEVVTTPTFVEAKHRALDIIAEHVT